MNVDKGYTCLNPEVLKKAREDHGVICDRVRKLALSQLGFPEGDAPEDPRLDPDAWLPSASPGSSIRESPLKRAGCQELFRRAGW
jgi:hypothetical protein